MNEWLEQYSTLAKNHNLPMINPVKLSIVCVELKSPEDVLAKINAFKPLQGWVSRQSSVLLIENETCFDDTEIILNAELSKGDENSFHIRQTANGIWLGITMTENAKNSEDEYFVETRRILSTEGVGKSLCQYLNYRVYWRDEGEELVERYFRFCGLSKERACDGY